MNLVIETDRIRILLSKFHFRDVKARLDAAHLGKDFPFFFAHLHDRKTGEADELKSSKRGDLFYVAKRHFIFCPSFWFQIEDDDFFITGIRVRIRITGGFGKSGDGLLRAGVIDEQRVTFFDPSDVLQREVVGHSIPDRAAFSVKVVPISSGIDAENQNRDINIGSPPIFQVPDELFEIRNAGRHLVCEGFYGDDLDAAIDMSEVAKDSHLRASTANFRNGLAKLNFHSQSFFYEIHFATTFKVARAILIAFCKISDRQFTAHR